MLTFFFFCPDVVTLHTVAEY